MTTGDDLSWRSLYGLSHRRFRHVRRDDVPVQRVRSEGFTVGDATRAGWTVRQVEIPPAPDVYPSVPWVGWQATRAGFEPIRCREYMDVLRAVEARVKEDEHGGG